MIIRTMILSGAIAGLVGMIDLLGVLPPYSLDFPTGYGFAGIAVALLGRNNPVGIALARCCSASSTARRRSWT